MHTYYFADNKRPKHRQFGRELSRSGTSRLQPQTFMFQSSTVTYGGPNGACYTSSTTRKTGANGVSIYHHLMNVFLHLPQFIPSPDPTRGSFGTGSPPFFCIFVG
jgi:hypothetical protein